MPRNDGINEISALKAMDGILTAFVGYKAVTLDLIFRHAAHVNGLW